MNLREFWEERVRGYRERVYLYFQGQEITYGNWIEKPIGWPMGFWNQGFEKETRSAFSSPIARSFSISGSD